MQIRTRVTSSQYIIKEVATQESKTAKALRDGYMKCTANFINFFLI